jgi:arylsulfatase A
MIWDMGTFPATDRRNSKRHILTLWQLKAYALQITIQEARFVRRPDKVQPGTTSDHVSAFWDFLPTVCEIAGAPIPEKIDGISFLPELTGKKQKEHEYLYWEFHERKTTDQAIRMGRWKAVRHSPPGPIELYDLETDVSETNDISAQHPEIVARIKTLFSEARTPHEIWKLIG